MTKRTKDYWKAYEMFSDFLFDKIKGKPKITKNFNIKQLILLWEDVFVKCLLAWGFSNKSAKMLFKWGESGHNWELLWFPGQNKTNPLLKEFEISLEELITKFYYETNYCSDRMHDDRLFRCHWQFNNFVYQFKQKYENKHSKTKTKNI
jgi:hypothetical protein